MISFNFGVVAWTGLLFFLDFLTAKRYFKKGGLWINHYGHLPSMLYISFLSALLFQPYVSDAYGLFTIFYPGEYLVNLLIGSESIWTEIRTNEGQELVLWPWAMAIIAHVVARLAGLYSRNRL